VIFERLRRRLTLINAGALVVVVAMLAVGAFLVTNKLLLDQEQGPLRAVATQAAQEYAERGPVSFQFEHGGYQLSGDFYVLWDPRGSLLFNPGSLASAALRPTAMQVAKSGTPDFAEIDLPSGDLLVYSLPVTYQDQARGSRGAAVLQVGRSLASVTRSESALIPVLGGVALAGLVLSLVAGWVLAGRALVPIENAFDRQRQFVANASHELRTPLSVIDAAVQLLRRHPQATIAENDDVFESAAQELARMRRLVEDLVTLARSDSGRLDLQVTEVDCEALVQRLIADLEPLAREHGSNLLAGTIARGRLLADPDRLRQLLLILIDNALTHTPAHTTVRIGAERHGRDLLITVSDDGPGIAPQERERALERFHRLGAGRTSSGSGLGLAIAQGLAEAHGGRIKLLDNRPGLRVDVTLPVGGRPGQMTSGLGVA